MQPPRLLLKMPNTPDINETTDNPGYPALPNAINAYISEISLVEIQGLTSSMFLC
jgi:hypothetical protein